MSVGGQGAPLARKRADHPAQRENHKWVPLRPRTRVKQASMPDTPPA